MNCTECLVQPALKAGWMMKIDGEEFGPYLSRDVALQAAIAGALARRRSGLPVHVAVKNDKGKVLAKRCLCPDFGR